MSLNKFTDFEGLDLNLKIGCDELKCKNPPWNAGGGVKLVGGQLYNNLDVSGVNHLYINDIDIGGTTAVLTGLQGGEDGQLLTITAGGAGGFVDIRNNATTGAPNEEVILTQTQADITIPVAGNTNGVATLQYIASLNKWLCNAN